MPKTASLAKKIVALFLIACSLSCAQGRIDPFDRTTGLSQSEIRDGLIKNQKKSKSSSLEKSRQEKNSAIPNVSKLMVTPPPPQIGGDKIISFSVTEQVPLKDVLIELGRLTKIDVDLDPKISGGIILNAKNRPFKEVLDRIATLGKLRYTYENNVLYFQPDKPYIKNYFVDYLQGGTLWTDVESNIRNILSPGGAGGNVGRSGAAAPTANSASNPTQNSAPAANAQTSANGGSGASSGGRSSGGGSSNSSTPSGGNQGSGSFVSPNGSSFSSNKSAGIISIAATSKEHDTISKYLSDVEKYASAQVLIEAKVVEVTLTDVFKTGIEWSSIGKTKTLTSANGYAKGGPINFIATELFNSDLSASITALETFGTTKTLSSPRIHAINNQKASLNFTDKLIYFTVSQSQTAAATGAGTTAPVIATTISSTKQEEDVGVQLDITPSINLRSNEVTMNIQPKLSVRSDWVLDPASPKDFVDPDGKRIYNLVPVIQTRTISTIAKIQSGGVFVIGGLMKESTTDTDTGIPFIQRIPVLGWLFKSTNKDSQITETVIFIKATIVNSNTRADKNDRDFQEKFDSNKRPYFQ